MRLTSFLISALLCSALVAQVPQAFDFQAVARDASGNVLGAQAVSVRLSVHSSSAAGPLAYQETHSLTTNAFGLFSLAVGQGTPTQGTFATVAWGSAPHFLHVELDATGGSSYVDMGTTQLLSVPYALHAGGIDCPSVSLLGDTLRQANGCFVIIPGLSAANGGCLDVDNDGYYNNAGCPPLDCDDTDPNVNPGATELCGTGEDEDCDGLEDELTDPAAFVTFFVDADSDGFGDASISNAACAQPVGYVTNDGDCDDSDASVFPGQNCSLACTAAEVAWVNANFDQYRQALMSAFTSCFFESDPGACIQDQLSGSGFPLSAECNACGITWANCVRTNCLIACVQGQAACETCMNTAGCNAGLMQCFGLTDADGDGWPSGSDCNDADATVYSGAPELCDTKDNDCDGQVDEGCGGCTDNDADGYTTCAGDCNDTDANVNPAAPEVCADGLDNDCDGLADEDCGTCLDNDGDGFTTCQGDCNDNNTSVFPGNVEVCADGLDNDCDGQADEGCGPQEICDGIDNDGDGQVDEGLNLGAACGCGGVLICDGNGGTTCSVPIGTEICADGIDNDCDGQVDEGCGGCTDNDADGYTTCAGDCDDTNASVNPAATEVCADGLDNDCDGLADEDCGSCLDNDGDGFTTCQGDCNDNNASVNPNAVEVCDGLDNDCDGLVNEGGVCGCAPVGTLCNDGNACTTNDTEDGACNCIGTPVSCDDGNPCTIDLCDPQTGCVHLPAPAGTACDDGNPNTINDACDGTGSCSGTPVQNEVCDGIDNDGDGLTDAADPSLVLVLCENQIGVCNGTQKTSNLCVGGTWLTCATSDYAVGSPVYEVSEVSCDTLDNDCDGQVDEDNVCAPCTGPDVCFINGQCFTIGQSNPDAYCQVCDPNNSSTEWSFRSAGTVCIQGTACTFSSVCDGAGQCSSVLNRPAGSLCDDGNPNTINDVCDGTGACTGTPIQNEVCDGIDNDGDGLTDAADPSLMLVLCENQIGVCNGTQKTSNLCVGGIWLTCATSDYSVGSPVYEVSEVSCDTQDNDCDGQVDEDNVCAPPAAPVITGSAPSSPSSNSTPTVMGTASDGSTVHFYESNSCQGTPLAQTAPVTGGFFGQLVPVTLNATTTLTARATSAGGVVSTCSAPFSYTHDNLPPATPGIMASTPLSPGSSTSPMLSGTGTPFTTVNIRTTANCLGTILATGTAAIDGTFSIVVQVSPGSTTTFHAQGVDEVGNTSGCSSGFSYTHTP